MVSLIFSFPVLRTLFLPLQNAPEPMAQQRDIRAWSGHAFCRGPEELGAGVWQLRPYQATSFARKARYTGRYNLPGALAYGSRTCVTFRA